MLLLRSAILISFWGLAFRAGAAERRGAAAAARGLQRRGPARPSRGRAWAAVTRRVACVRSARSAHGPKTLALRARGARARGKKRRAGVLGRRRRPRRENCVRKGGAVPLLGADRLFTDWSIIVKTLGLRTCTLGCGMAPKEID